MSLIGLYWKAVVGFLAPGVVTLVAAVQDSSPAAGSVTGAEWVGIAAASILTAAGVYAAPSADKIARRTAGGQIVATSSTPGIDAGTPVDVAPSEQTPDRLATEVRDSPKHAAEG